MITSEYLIEYIAVIERPDGSTYEQPFSDLYDLIELAGYLGDDYQIVSIY